MNGPTPATRLAAGEEDAVAAGLLDRSPVASVSQPNSSP